MKKFLFGLTSFVLLGTLIIVFNVSTVLANGTTPTTLIGTPKVFTPDGVSNFPNEIYLPDEKNPNQSKIHSDFAANTDACASCHSPHTANGPDLLQWPTNFDTCTACHDGTVSTTYDVEGGTYTALDNGSTQVNSGGLFGFEAPAPNTNKLIPRIDNTGGTTTGQTSAYLSRHHVESDLFTSSAPGGKGSSSPDQYGTWSDTFGCEECHDPHNNGRNARLLNPDPNGVETAKYDQRLADQQPYLLSFVPSTSIPTKYVTTGDTATYYTITDDKGKLARILKDSYNFGKIKVYRGTSPDTIQLDPASIHILWADGSGSQPGYTIIKIDQQSPALTSSDTVTGYFVVALVVDMDIQNYLESNETVTYKSGIDDFCGACHTDYNTTPVGGGSSSDNLSGVYSQTTHHPLEVVVNPVPGLKFETDPDGTKHLVCLSCHVAHGVNQQYWQMSLVDKNIPGWDSSMLYESAGSSYLKRMPNMGICENCHQM